MKRYFLQNWGTYDNQTFVCLGLSYEELLRINKRLGAKKWFMDELKKDELVLRGHIQDGANAFCMVLGGGTILWFRDWKNDWPHIETLVHELHHAVYYTLHKNRCMDEEIEAQAYQQEFLFREIRRKMSKYFTK